jgi:hypothetical protein
MNDAQSKGVFWSGCQPTWVWCAAVFAVAFFWMLMSGAILDDHFNRISRGWQIWVYGESPFIDFRDPGYYLTLYASAAMQALSGGSLLGEAVLDCTAIALAVVLTFLLVAEASQSLAVGLFAVALALGVSPRYYDYDKVLFYGLGLMCCWRYTDRRSVGLVVVTGLLTTAAGLFRYDNGLILAAAFLVTLVACHGRDLRALARMSATYGLVVMLAVMPFLIGWQRTIGVPEVWRQISTYAAQEGGQSPLFQLQTIAGDAPFVAWIYVGSIVLIPLVIGSFFRTGRSDDGAFARPVPKMLAVLVVSGLLAAFVLRNPIDARLGAAVPTFTVLGGYLIGRWVPRRSIDALPVRFVALGLVMLAVAVAGVRAARTLEAPSVARTGRLVVGQVVGQVVGHVRALAAAPADLTALPSRERYGSIVEYLRACTPVGSRVLTTWFAPQVHYFAQRGFAGGMLVFLGQPWNSAVDQARTVEQLESQDVSLVLVESRSLAQFNRDYGRVADYLERHYRLAGTSSFGVPDAGLDAYRVLVRASEIPDHTEGRWDLPCLVTRRARHPADAILRAGSGRR